MKESVEYFYRITSKIGEGTYSEVFKASDMRDDQIVAVKKVKIRNAEQGLPKEFVREVESLQRVLHPNVIQIKEIFVGKTNINIVYPFSCTDLEKLMTKVERPFSMPEIRYLMKMLFKGVSKLHDLGMMHRDIKPSNLLLDSDCVLKVADFG